MTGWLYPEGHSLTYARLLAHNSFRRVSILGLRVEGRRNSRSLNSNRLGKKDTLCRSCPRPCLSAHVQPSVPVFVPPAAQPFSFSSSSFFPLLGLSVPSLRAGPVLLLFSFLVFFYSSTTLYLLFFFSCLLLSLLPPCSSSPQTYVPFLPF